ncbi:hypothetical protein CO669_31190 [Bradyrhizobium sp. Y36]|uniref:hypothetical protein n=1 Tax=Bradyrhizobium sp. Y36 TaxID=2035447 RepID=UPI000BE96427|nr:hypothetical protein [Bradyrhizobium sp. Y36]PDT85747.1 hypothetical protein CO669_31190 [Bradyrhizobium sp. Y36]
MRARVLCLVLALAAHLAPAAARDAKRCPPDFSVENRLDAEQKAALNLNARERAAIEDLKYATMAPIREKYDRNEIDRDAYNRLTKQRDDALNCIDADNNLKDQQSYYTEQTKLIEAGCQKGPVDKMYAGWLKEGQERKAKACAKADLEYLAQMVKQLKEIQADKLAKEEKSTPAVKTVDASQKSAPFCDQIRAVTGHAPNLFAAITKEKKEKWFIEPGTLGSKGVKISDIAAIDEYATPITVSQDFLAARAECAIKVGTDKDITLRIVPTYACDWRYDKTNRRELEQRTDRLLNLVRGCFGSVKEDGEFYRHQFVGDGAVNVSGDLYYGEGKPSRIYLEIAKHTPEEDRACINYGFQRKEQDKKLCMSRLKP